MTLTSNQAFRVGEVITQSVQTTIRNIIPFGVIAVIAFVIIAVLIVIVGGIFGLSVPMGTGMMQPGMPMQAPGAGLIIGFIIVGLLSFAIYMSVMAAITYGTVQDLRGQPVGIGDLLQSTVNLVAPAIGTVITLIGVWFAAEIVAIILNFIPILGPIVSLVMFAFLYVALWVVIPVAVIERPGAIASLQRSFALTQGNRWKIIGILLILVAMIIAAVLVMMVLMFVSSTLALILMALFYAGIGIFSAVLIAVGYYKLRVAKEGADIGDIAKVFD